ncbi:TPA: Gfo/Idh/MocA family oxidoreductase, partial [Candidatus Bathyarchaeota archaeon]|nr:Gfo/Idh/MocA family oxidoreductase [Candidatus Bathyarchaeota archaeon]
MDQIDVGVIGAGAQANLVHYPSLAEIPYANIAAICDLDEERLNKTADKYGVKLRFKDYKRMLDEVDLDAVYIIMAPQLLDPIVTYCLRKKKNVFIEKPAGISVEQNRRWAEEAKANGCITMVGYNRRFIPVVMEAKRIVEESGPITQCMVTFHKCTPEAIRMRKIKREPGTIGPYMGDVCHAIDLLRWAGGDVKEIFSYVSKHYSAETNTYNALLLF